MHLLDLSIFCLVNDLLGSGRKYECCSASCPHLADRVDVAVGQQLFLQGAQQLVEVSRLAAV